MRKKDGKIDTQTCRQTASVTDRHTFDRQRK